MYQINKLRDRTFFRDERSWPVLEDHFPLLGWKLEEVLDITGLPQNDLYGKLFFYLQNKFRRFVDKLRNKSFRLYLCCQDAVVLAKMIRRSQLPDGFQLQSFDRIDVSRWPS